MFKKLWLSYDYFSIFCAIVISWWLAIHFLLYGALDSTIKMSRISLALIVFTYSTILLGVNIFYFEKASILFILLLCFFMVEMDVTRAYKNMTNHQNFSGYIVGQLVWGFLIFSEALRTEADSVTDCLVLIMLLLTYF